MPRHPFAPPRIPHSHCYAPHCTGRRVAALCRGVAPFARHSDGNGWVSPPSPASVSGGDATEYDAKRRSYLRVLGVQLRVPETGDAIRGVAAALSRELWGTAGAAPPGDLGGWVRRVCSTLLGGALVQDVVLRAAAPVAASSASFACQAFPLAVLGAVTEASYRFMNQVASSNSNSSSGGVASNSSSSSGASLQGGEWVQPDNDGLEEALLHPQGEGVPATARQVPPHEAGDNPEHICYGHGGWWSDVGITMQAGGIRVAPRIPAVTRAIAARFTEILGAVQARGQGGCSETLVRMARLVLVTINFMRSVRVVCGSVR